MRPVADEHLHITLVFIGERPEEEVEDIGRAGLGAAEGLPAPVVRPLRLVAVPHHRRPRLFALDIDDPEGRAAGVQRAVSGALEAAGLHRPEARPFWPHVTLARVRGGGRREGAPPRRAPGPERPLPLDPEALAAELRLDRVTLYRSRLSPAGARYEPLAGRQLMSG